MEKESSLDPQIQEAINAALANDWEKALILNQRLLRKYPKDVETMNRLARAFSETGKIREAKRLYQKVLKLDPYNQIAERNLKRLYSIKGKALKENNKLAASLKGDLFLEEPGKTAVVSLTDTAMPSILATLQTGDRLKLTPHKRVVTVVSENGQRIGKLNDSFSERIAADLRVGSKFEAFIKSVSLKAGQGKGDSQVTIFIRETSRSPKVHQAPFPTSTVDFTPYVREDTLQSLSEQAPVPIEVDNTEGTLEEIELNELPSIHADHDESLEELAAKEAAEGEEELGEE